MVASYLTWLKYKKMWCIPFLKVYTIFPRTILSAGILILAWFRPFEIAFSLFGSLSASIPYLQILVVSLLLLLFAVALRLRMKYYKEPSLGR